MIMVNIPTAVLSFCGIALGVFLVTSNFHLNAYALPIPGLSVSPSCGPVSGFTLLIKAKGFQPNGVLAWKLVDSDGNAPLIGYFHIDGNGKVNEKTSIDDVKLGNYKLQVGDDRNIDFKFDSNIRVTQSDITIPCKGEGENHAIGEHNDIHKVQKIEEKNKCKTENENEDHSKDNGNENEHACADIGLNPNNVEIGISPQPSMIAGQNGEISAQSGR